MKKIAIIGHKGFLGSRIHKAIPEAVGIGRGELNKILDNKFDWIINCAMKYRGTDEEIITDNMLPFLKCITALTLHNSKIIQFGTIMEGREFDLYTMCKAVTHEYVYAGEECRNDLIYYIPLGDVYDPEDTSRGKYIDKVINGEKKIIENSCDYNKSMSACYPTDYQDIIKYVIKLMQNKPCSRDELYCKAFIADGCSRGQRWYGGYVNSEMKLLFQKFMRLVKKEKKNEF